MEVLVHGGGRVHENLHETYVSMRAHGFFRDQTDLLIHARHHETPPLHGKLVQ